VKRDYFEALHIEMHVHTFKLEHYSQPCDNTPKNHARSEHLRPPLHLEAGPIRCVRGLKSSLVIGQKAQIGPNPFTPRGQADLVV
jgi:hypothetical protein